MDSQEFDQQLSAWIEDVRAEATRLYDIKCAVPQILNIAIAIANARLAESASRRQSAIAVPMPPHFGRVRSDS